MPALAADWCAVTTIEGIGSTHTKLHPVQERMTQMHGSQCGFCTPGIVMALYTQFRTSADVGTEELLEHLDGNLCRCTGYRPILQAFKDAFAPPEGEHGEGELAIGPEQGCCRARPLATLSRCIAAHCTAVPEKS